MTYILYMDTTLVERERYMLLSIMATLVIAGISLISAAADWFIER